VPTIVIVTYQFNTDGTSVATMYCNNLSAVSSAVFNGPLYAAAPGISIAATNDGTSFETARFADFVLLNGYVFSAFEAKRIVAQWCGLVSSSGNTISITTNSTPVPSIMLAPPASGLQPFLVQLPTNTNMVSSPAIGIGGLYNPTAVTIGSTNPSFEAWSSGTPTGYTETNVPGNGSADWTQDTDNMAEGASGAKLTLTGTTSSSTLDGSCIAYSAKQDAPIHVYAKKASGTANCNIRMLEYSGTGCTGLLQTDNITTAGDLATVWTRYGSTWLAASWNANVKSFKLRINCASGAHVATWDAITFSGNGIDSTAFCNANSSCRDVGASISDAPIALPTYTIEGTISSDLLGTNTSSRSVYCAAGWPEELGDANERDAWLSGTSSETGKFACDQHDITEGARVVRVAMASNLYEEWDFRSLQSNNGRHGCCVKLHSAVAWTCGTEMTDVYISNSNPTMYIASCGSGTTGGHIYLRNLTFKRVWSMY
jgi:hypothetical protein